MSDNCIKNVEYVPPIIEIIEASDIMEKLGPVVSCSSFGGSTSGC